MNKWVSSLIGAVLLTAATVNVSYAGSFTYGAGEDVVYFNDFNDASGLALANPPVPGLAQPGVGVSGGELHGTPDCFFCSATHTFQQPLSLDNGAISAYFSFRTDISTGEELGKAYLKMNLTNESGVYNQRNVALNVRPGSPSGFYAMVVDPGDTSGGPITQQALLAPPAGTFANTATYESFKMVFTKTGADEVEIVPFWFNEATGTWDALLGRSGTNSTILASITNDFGGLSSFASATIQLAYDVPYADAFAITQVPEPSSVLGLVALGLLGAGWQYRRKQLKA